MDALNRVPLDQALANVWRRIDPAYRRAFFFVVVVNLLAFGFEMSNLTLHHDDVLHFFVQSPILNYYLGRFGFIGLHYYTQSGYFLPFLQMVEGILAMTAYGLVIARLWGLRQTADIVLVASVLCVFPFMAQIYQYNTGMATYSVAHLLAAAAVTLSVRATARHTVAAALLYLAAFSIYQSVLANAAAIFGLWVLTRLMFEDNRPGFFSTETLKAAGSALVSALAGGILYLFAVSLMDIPFDAYQGADTAFTFSDGVDLQDTLAAVLQGTRAFFFWPQQYLPGYIKTLQIVFVTGAGLACLWLPRNLKGKAAAVLILALTAIAPRLLQLLHPAGHYHDLTLTGYAVVVAGCVAIALRAWPTLGRNLAMVAAAALVAGYVLQSSWISTVNYLNTQAHYATLTQILARLRSLPATEGWDGKTAVVVGSYRMPTTFPFKPATGVATSYLDANHMQNLARLMRDEITFLAEDEAPPAALRFAATHPIWPHPNSVGVADGVPVVVLSKEDIDPRLLPPGGNNQ
jgi:hypothetical protein